MASDPIDEIVREMQKVNAYNCLPGSASCVMLGINWLDWLTRLSAYWTPERAAFMDAAEMVGGMELDLERLGRVDASERRRRLRQLGLAYRALVEPEKVKPRRAPR